MQSPSEVGVRLAKIIPRLGSNHDGEMLATAAAIERTLRSEGLDWHDFTVAVQTGLKSLRTTGAVPAPTTPARRGTPPPPPPEPFLELRGKPSDKQFKWLQCLCRRHGVEIENG